MSVNEADRNQALPDNRDERNFVHVHTYTAETGVANSHQHVITGVTAPARIEGRSHVHRIRIRTSFVDGHWHWFDMVTDTATNFQTLHAHYFTGVSSVQAGHSHTVSGVSDLATNLDACSNVYKRSDEKKK